jgi:ribonucleoside-diphosphate reductase alpha chain
LLTLSEAAKKVLEARYLIKDPSGNPIETPEEMFWRVAKHVAKAESEHGEEWAEKFYQLMSSLTFLPNSPTLMNAGRRLGQLAACFVLPIDDSLSSIFTTLKRAALIHQSGGGTGFSFSRLRPRGDTVASTHGVASGPVSFMRVFDMATEVIKQGGTRRGANMGVLRIDHPDIREFITAKRDPFAFQTFNLSVGISDDFMKALKRGELFPLINPRTKQIVTKVWAKDLFELMVQCAWENGEPGALFLDTINRHNPTPSLGQIEATNPCGEQPLLPNEACNLGSINLVKILKKGLNGFEIDWEKLREVVHLAVRFLDDVVEVNRYPFKAIEKICKANRKIGLGVMGFAHMLILLGIPYDSDQALKLAQELMGFISQEAKRASQALAEEKGPFPNFPLSIYAQRGEKPQRNATLTTIAPTGTISLIANCSSGIEPLFALSYKKRMLGELEVPIVDPVFEMILEKENFLTPHQKEEVLQKGFIPPEMPIEEKYKRLFLTAFQIPPERHVEIQAAFQRYTDNAVSKTINFPREATSEKVGLAFLLAYELGCKGITVYRSGSRQGQVITCGLSRLC